MKTAGIVIGLFTAILLAAPDHFAVGEDTYACPELLMKPSQLAKPDMAKQYLILRERCVRQTR